MTYAPSKPKILVTGASGFLGGNLCRQATQEFNVHGAYCKKALNQTICSTSPCDLTDWQSVKALLSEFQPDIVFHLAALASPEQCAENPQLSESINVNASVELAKQCADRNIRLVFTSTDLVFKGDVGNYDEAAPAEPVNLYGEHKLAAENGILALDSNAIICRMPLMYGQSFVGRLSFLESMRQQLSAGKTLNLFTDEFRSIASAECACQGLLLVGQMDLTGIIHLGGPERLSRMAMGQILTRQLGLSESQLKPCLQSELTFKANRPADVSLNSNKAFQIGYRPKSLN